MTIDAWMQHPTPRLQAHPMLESLRRWTGMATLTEALPIELTLAAMDAAGVELGMICAWSSPEGFLVGNDEVAGWVAAHPTRLAGLAAVDLRAPMPAATIPGLWRSASTAGPAISPPTASSS